MEEIRNAYNILVIKPEGKVSLSRPRRMGKVKVKLYLCLTKHHAMKTYCGVEV
jgi:hypothetical protein